MIEPKFKFDNDERNVRKKHLPTLLIRIWTISSGSLHLKLNEGKVLNVINESDKSN